jgi:hypothetical protein
MDWDVFISHAWEDKESFARPLAKALEAKGLRVWFDEFTLRVGDSLRRSIDRGLAKSRYGVVILSPNFFGKEWPQKELDALVSRESLHEKIILPVWHNITVEQVRRHSPMLADRVAVSSSRGLEYVVTELLRVVRPAFVQQASEMEVVHPTEQQKTQEGVEAPPTPTPTPRCEISEPIFDEAYFAKWQVTNNDSNPTEINAIYINWPSDKTGKLYRIWFTPRPIQTEKIIWTDLDGENPPLTISSGWNEEGIRSIDGGGAQKTLEFEFGKWKSGSNNPDLYSLHVTFDNGCEVSLQLPLIEKCISC